MRQWFSISLLCCAQLLASGCADLNSPVIDYPGISTTAITPTSITIGWNKATDGLSPPTALVYKVYVSGANPAYQSFDTIAEVEAGTLVATLIDADTTPITGLTAGNAYYINIVVEDEEGNKAVYDPLGEYVHANQLAYYPFNGKVNGNDVVGTNHFVVPLVTGFAAPALAMDRFSHVLSAYHFAPTATTSQCLQSTTNVGIVGNASRTVSFWVQSENTPVGTTRVPFAWGDGSSNGSNFGVYETGIGNDWFVWLYGTADVSTATPATTNWEHWVIGYDSGTNIVYTYKNGVVVNNGTAPAVIANTVDSLLYVGCGVDPTGTLAHPYMGKIDDVRIFDVSPTFIDVANLYDKTRP